MEDDGRWRTRRALRARNAATRLRGKYRRALRDARLQQDVRREAPGRPGEHTPPHPAMPPFAPARPGPSGQHIARRIPRWVLIAACLPPLILGVLGSYTVAVIAHTEYAVHKVSVPSVADQLRDSTAVAPPANLFPAAPPDASPMPVSNPSSVPPGAMLPAQPDPGYDHTAAFTVMLLGVEDQRNGADDPSRSDSIILAYVDPVAKHINLISIPRDLQVQQADGSGLAKMADVYAHGDLTNYKGVGGIGLVWDTVQRNFHIRIDYFVRVNFDGFQQIVDAVGGVTVDNPYPIKDDTYPTPDFQYTRVYFPAGIMHLNGAEALQYARTRHDDSDYARNTRQQQIILAIREQALKTNLFPKATSLIDALSDAFRTDLPQDQWLGFAYFIKGLSNKDIVQFTLTDLLYDNPQNGIYYSAIDWSMAIARMKEFSPQENTDYLNAMQH